MSRQQRNEDESANEYLPEDIAQSLFRAVQGALTAQEVRPEGEPPPKALDWNGLSTEQQSNWMILATAGRRIVEAGEGLPVRHVAVKLYSALKPDAEPWETLAAGEKLIWEMCVRHLALIVDCDELQNLAEAEGLWPQWLTAKLEEQQQQEMQATK